MNKAILPVIAGSLVMASSAMAIHSSPLTKGQWYQNMSVGAYGGYVHEDVDQGKSHYAFGAGVGYTLTKYLGGSLGYMHFPSHEVGSHTYRTNVMTAAATIQAPAFNSNIDVFGKLGVAFRFVDVGGDNANLVSPYFAFGAQYPVMPKLTFDVQANCFPGVEKAGGERLYLVGAGLNYQL